MYILGPLVSPPRCFFLLSMGGRQPRPQGNVSHQEAPPVKQKLQVGENILEIVDLPTKIIDDLLYLHTNIYIYHIVTVCYACVPQYCCILLFMYFVMFI